VDFRTEKNPSLLCYLGASSGEILLWDVIVVPVDKFNGRHA
jgi:hypothetical protein